MSARSNFRSYSEDLAKTPGPARYSATHNEIYLKRNPQEHSFSLLSQRALLYLAAFRFFKDHGRFVCFLVSKLRREQ